MVTVSMRVPLATLELEAESQGVTAKRVKAIVGHAPMRLNAQRVETISTSTMVTAWPRVPATT